MSAMIRTAVEPITFLDQSTRTKWIIAARERKPHLECRKDRNSIMMRMIWERRATLMENGEGGKYAFLFVLKG